MSSSSANSLANLVFCSPKRIKALVIVYDTYFGRDMGYGMIYNVRIFPRLRPKVKVMYMILTETIYS